MKSTNIRKNTRATILKLMEQTRERRRKWVIDDKPSVSEVLASFSLLKDPIVVSTISIITNYDMYKYMYTSTVSFRMSTGQS